MNEPVPRRTPKQDRSRERVDAIVEASRRLIGQRGNDAVSVREIALQAGVPISSVYQYFPDKNAILRVLILDYFERIRLRLARIMDGVNHAEDLPGAVEEMVDALIRLFRREPAMGTIWSSVQANVVLRAVDMEDTREFAEFLQELFRKVLPDTDTEQIFDVSLFAVHVIPNTIRVAHYARRGDRDRIIRELKRLIRLRIRSLIDGSG
jgi:AcrR family transcriptional regulator